MSDQAPTVPAPTSSSRVRSDAVAPVIGPAEPTVLQRFWPGPGRAAPRRDLALAVLVGLLAAVALPGHRPGLGLAVTAAAVGSVSALPLRRDRRWLDLAGVVLAVALVCVVAVRDAPWVAVLAVVGAAAMACVALTAARSWVSVGLCVPALCHGSVRAAPWAARGGVELAGARGARVWPLLRAGGVAAVLVLVFGLLFASADVVFASLVPEVGLSRVPVHVLALVLGAGAALVVAHLASASPRWEALSLPPGRQVRRAEWLVPVVALDALVLTFVGVQVTALLGGHRHVVETAGLSYAQYARQGFGQLVAVTLLTLGVVAVAARRAPRRTHADRVVTSGALAVLVLATLGVVASALRRMDLYVDAFGLTRLRLLVSVFEVCLGVVLVLVVVAGVRWRGAWLPRAVTVVAALSVLSLAALDPDALIVERNVERFREGAALDVEYLSSLSLDAVPALDALPEPQRSCALERMRTTEQDGWGGWSLARQRAADVLRERTPMDTSLSTCHLGLASPD